MPVPSLDAINASLATVNDPEINRPITDLGMLKSVDVRPDGSVDVGIYLTVSSCPMRESLTDRVAAAVSAVADVTAVRVELDVMSDEQRAAMRASLRGGGEEREVPFNRPGSLTRVYAITSGKGGVGKSTVAVNLALALAALGKRLVVDVREAA